MQQRKDDQTSRTYFRTDRLFHQTGGWYFATRDGDHGPFPTRGMAEAALRQYVAEVVELRSFRGSRGRPAPHVFSVVPRAHPAPQPRRKPKATSVSGRWPSKYDHLL